jgi:hypothetical protein
VSLAAHRETTASRAPNTPAIASGTGTGGRAPADAAPSGAPDFNLDGMIRDERGIRMAPASDD